MPVLTPHYAPVLHVKRARGQVGTQQAGTATHLSAASSKLLFGDVVSFFEQFIFNVHFKALPVFSHSLLFFPALHGYAFGAE